MLMVLRAAILLLAIASVTPAHAAAPLLPEQPGWTTDKQSTQDERGGLGIYHRGDTRAVIFLVTGALADGVAASISTMRPEQFVPPFPQDRWTERGARLWATERDGFAYEVGVVFNYEPGHPDRSAYASITGTRLTKTDALMLLHRLDWDAIRDVAAAQ